MPEPRRTFVPVVLLGLGASALTAVAAAKSWAGPRGGSMAGAMLDPGVQSPVAGALSLVLLASWGVLLVTRGAVRRVFAVLASVAAGGVLAAAVAGYRSLPEQARTGSAQALGRATGLTGWYWAAAVAALLALVASLLAVRLVPHWPLMGSRYDAPGTARRAEAVAEPESERDLWDAMDQGRDPTDRRPDPPGL